MERAINLLALLVLAFVLYVFAGRAHAEAKQPQLDCVHIGKLTVCTVR
jgi:hypothetical protein